MSAKSSESLEPKPQRNSNKKRASDEAHKLQKKGRTFQTEELILPNAEETEREVLGIFLFDQDAIQKAMDCGLTTGIFGLRSHQIIFSGMKAFLDNKGWSLTPKSLTDYLTNQHLIDKAGGGAYISHLIDARVSKPERLAGLIQQLKDMDYKRMAVRKGVELQNMGSNGAMPPEIDAFLDTIPRINTTSQKYLVTPAGIVHKKPAKVGYGYENDPVTTFIAKIVTELHEDDGSSEEQKIFELEILLKGQTLKIEVPASKFDAMSWVTIQLGAEASIWPGKNDHARFAIKELSPSIAKRTVYAHTGWRQIDGGWCYLHGGGAITTNGNRTDINVRLPHPLRFFLLPDPPTGDQRRAAYDATLELLDAFPRALTIPLLGAIYGAILGEPDYSIYIAGQSGCFKSETTSIAQSFFGSGFTRVTMPANWYDTAAVILTKAFTMKDALMIVDDFAPTGQKRHDDELHTKAEIVFRAAGNRSGRGGLRSDQSVRLTKEPRGLLGSSGEDLPRGHSVQNRLLIVPLTKGEITTVNLTAMQKMAASGTFALSTSAFLRYMSHTYEKSKAKFDEERITYRDKLTKRLGSHARQPTTIAHLAAAWCAWLRGAVADKAITAKHSQTLWEQIWKTLCEIGGSQSDLQGTLHPVDHFLNLLRSALTAGKAHLQTVAGGQPQNVGMLCGWRDGKPNGECVGWVDNGTLYLEMDSAYGIANTHGLRNNEGLQVGKRVLAQRLDERKLIVIKEDGRGNKCRVPGTRIPAVAISLNAIFDTEDAQSN